MDHPQNHENRLKGQLATCERMSPGCVILDVCARAVEYSRLCCNGRPRLGRTVAVQTAGTAYVFRPTWAWTRNFLHGLRQYSQLRRHSGQLVHTEEGSRRSCRPFQEGVLSRPRQWGYHRQPEGRCCHHLDPKAHTNQSMI